MEGSYLIGGWEEMKVVEYMENKETERGQLRGRQWESTVGEEDELEQSVITYV